MDSPVIWQWAPMCMLCVAGAVGAFVLEALLIINHYLYSMLLCLDL